MKKIFIIMSSVFLIPSCDTLFDQLPPSEPYLISYRVVIKNECETPMQFVAQNFILNEYKEKNLFLGESSEMLFVWCDVFRNLYTKIRLISPLDELNECLDESYLSTIKIYNLTHNFDKPRLIEILRNSQLTKNKANDIYTWEIIDPSLCP